MYLKIEILEVKQPLGVFYIASLDAYSLLKIVRAEPYRATIDGEFAGIQRPENRERLFAIADYLKGIESAMPNSIIIAGNSVEDLKQEEKWFILNESKRKYLIIPAEKIAGSIIDGQHRLKGFNYVTDELKRTYNLLCSIYLDLPVPYQAYLFATINMNQKTVDKSLAFELYGYNLDEEKKESWSPEKLAVYLTRALNFEKDSIFYNRILVAAENDEVLFEVSPKLQEWYISTASMVDGILSLISSNPKKDRDILQQLAPKERNRSILNSDRTPLREFFKQGNDKLILTIVKNFFSASIKTLYKKESYLFKTVGIQAQFSVLKELLKDLPINKDISEKYYISIIEKCSKIDFHDNFFTASGLGKSRILNVLLLCLNLKEIEEIRRDSDKNNYLRLLNITK